MGQDLDTLARQVEHLPAPVGKTHDTIFASYVSVGETAAHHTAINYVRRDERGNPVFWHVVEAAPEKGAPLTPATVWHALLPPDRSDYGALKAAVRDGRGDHAFDMAHGGVDRPTLTLAEGDDLSRKFQTVLEAASQIDREQHQYNPLLQNSNTFANTIAAWAGLPRPLGRTDDGKGVFAPASENVSRPDNVARDIQIGRAEETGAATAAALTAAKTALRVAPGVTKVPAALVAAAVGYGAAALFHRQQDDITGDLSPSVADRVASGAGDLVQTAASGVVSLARTAMAAPDPAPAQPAERGSGDPGFQMAAAAHAALIQASATGSAAGDVPGRAAYAYKAAWPVVRADGKTVTAHRHDLTVRKAL